jgi:hypothetical protein
MKRLPALGVLLAPLATLTPLALVLALAAGGCTPVSGRARVASELGAAPSNAAQVCVVRPDEESSQVVMKLTDNGRLVGATRGRTYACWLAAPGDHQIASDADDTGPTPLHAKAGARYFLHLEVADVDDHAHAHLDFIEEHVAGEMIDACDTRVLVSVPGHDDAADALPFAPASPM